MSRLLVAALLVLPSLARAADFGVDATNYDGPAWSPYIVGGAIGVLSWLTFYFADKTIGASSFYATLAGFVGKTVAPKHTESLPYYKDNPPGGGLGLHLCRLHHRRRPDRGDDGRRV